MPIPILVGGGYLLTAFCCLHSRAYSSCISGYWYRCFFSGLDQGLDLLQASVNAALGGLTIDVKNLLDMSGITTGITWIINAHAFRLFVSITGKVMFMRSSKA